MQTLYADILFLINFCMDFFSLYLSVKILMQKVRLKHLLSASVLGAFYSVFSTIYCGNAAVSFIIGIAAAFVLCYIAVGRTDNVRLYLKTVVLFFIISLLLGGIITFLYSALNRVFAAADFSARDNTVKAAVFILLGAIGALCINISNRILYCAVRTKMASIKVVLDKKTVTLDALVDSGNLLRDPISGRQVIVVTMASVEPVLPFDIRRIIKSNSYDLSDLSMRNARRIRLIPAKGIGGNRTFIALVPDRIELIGKEGKKEELDALIAVEDSKKYNFAGYNAVMPATLIH